MAVGIGGGKGTVQQPISMTPLRGKTARCVEAARLRVYRSIIAWQCCNAKNKLGVNVEFSFRHGRDLVDRSLTLWPCLTELPMRISNYRKQQYCYNACLLSFHPEPRLGKQTPDRTRYTVVEVKKEVLSNNSASATRKTRVVWWYKEIKFLPVGAHKPLFDSSCFVDRTRGEAGASQQKHFDKRPVQHVTQIQVKTTTAKPKRQQAKN